MEKQKTAPDKKLLPGKMSDPVLFCILDQAKWENNGSEESVATHEMIQNKSLALKIHWLISF